MVYKENFVVAIKSNGKILREINDIVTLPFGSEYSILLKNLNSVSAVVDIDIDGKSVIQDGSIIVPSNSSTELKGILEGFTVRNRFKFIQKTKEISDYRGDRVDDGIIRIEYQFEKKQPEIIYVNPVYKWYNNDWDIRSTWSSYYCSDNIAPAIAPSRSSTTYSTSTSTKEQNSTSLEPPCTDGITVKGSDTEQNFQIGWIGTLETNSHVINIVLKGTDSRDKEVEKPIYVKTKYVCETCGKTSDSNSKFCARCGTKLL